MPTKTKEPKEPAKATEVVQRATAEKAQKAAEERYRERFKELMTPIGKHLNYEKIGLAVVVMIDPETNQPMLTYRGEPYEAAKLTKWTFEQFRRKVAETLAIEK